MGQVRWFWLATLCTVLNILITMDICVSCYAWVRRSPHKKNAARLRRRRVHACRPGPTQSTHVVPGLHEGPGRPWFVQEQNCLARVLWYVSQSIKKNTMDM